MMRHLSIRIMALAGICFLLHILVPHHHHADLSSIIEHQRIIECAEGMHDHEATGEEHHHHEELLSESDYTFDDTSYDTVKSRLQGAQALQDASCRHVLCLHKRLF